MRSTGHAFLPLNSSLALNSCGIPQTFGSGSVIGAHLCPHVSVVNVLSSMQCSLKLDTLGEFVAGFQWCRHLAEYIFRTWKNKRMLWRKVCTCRNARLLYH